MDKSKVATSSDIENSIADSESLPEDFLTFYKAFHEDSMFQINHIHFPLEGLPDNADPVEYQNEKYYWTSDNWVMNKMTFHDTTKFLVTRTILGEILVEEKITILQYDLSIIRRFAKSSSGWNLIYYAGINKYTNSKNLTNSTKSI